MKPSARKQIPDSAVVITPEQLSERALQGVIEEFVTREGTDYGMVEFSLEEKVAHIRRGLQRGEWAIVFDTESESVTIVPRREISPEGRIS